MIFIKMIVINRYKYKNLYAFIDANMYKIMS
ncbi:hypothetical protein SAMN05421740_102361 [Parapedobacter koreensis]|uniref:Uncharacterized protein n=1 Tax=Parapedobacter koreensis TaxID=332977 RepID=A0A1H7ITQ0_9SPHI|nr:hypothetical protein SAMN05421740_102361 [Parapedobacter koreensis]